MDYAYHVFLLLGGIALFLFGINFLSQSLYEALGDNLRTVLEKLTKTPVLAVLLGVVVTALIQSSGATMVMVTGFVAAQLMTLSRGIMVMLGASIGTTVTAQIIAFKIDPWAPLILFIGLVLYQFVKSRRLKKIGAIILGFGMLFCGIYLMGEAIAKMSLGSFMMSFLKNFSNPLLALLFGFVITFAIQSSSASVGILQVMMGGLAASEFSLASVTYMIMGMNVGAVAPVILAALSGNRAGRRAALASVINKLLSVILFALIMLIWPSSVNLIADLSPGDVSRQIANFHLIFNLVGSLCLFPFAGMLAKALTSYMPDDPSDTLFARKLLYIGKGQDKAPAVMIAQCRQEIFRFADMVYDNYVNANKALKELNVELALEVEEKEKTINFLNREIYEYLLRLHGKLLPERDLAGLGRMFSILTDLERIGDHADNIAEYTVIAVEKHATVSKPAWLEVLDMSEKSVNIVSDAINAYKNKDFALLRKVQTEEDMMDLLKETLENNHVERMKQQTCDPRGGTLFIDIIVDFERVADHAMNIAETLLGADAPIKI